MLWVNGVDQPLFKQDSTIKNTPQGFVGAPERRRRLPAPAWVVIAASAWCDPSAARSDSGGPWFRLNRRWRARRSARRIVHAPLTMACSRGVGEAKGRQIAPHLKEAIRWTGW